jgi:AcrR family transcriptional regulator
MADMAVRQSQQRGRDRRKAIVDAAMQLIAERGPSDGSLNDVGERAGITHVGVLYHFKSRRELLLAVLAERDRVAQTQVRELFVEGGVAALRALPEVARWEMSEPNFTKLILVLAAEALGGDDETRDYFLGRYLYVRQGLTRTLRMGQERGEFRADVDIDLRAAQIAAFIDGIPIQHFIEPDRIDMVAVYEDYVAAVLRDLAVPGGTSARSAPARPKRSGARTRSPG